MSTKFNRWGQWTLSTDSKETSLIKGIKAESQEASSKDPSSGLTGADATRLALHQAEHGKLPEMNKIQLQPTNEQLFGHLAVSSDKIEKAEKAWNNTFNSHFDLIKLKIDHLNKSKVEKSWGQGKSFNSLLDEKELAERNGFIGNE